jgi:serine/threonine protein kinase
MEYLDGEDLEHAPGARRAASRWRTAVQIIKQLASALAVAPRRRDRPPRSEAGQRVPCCSVDDARVRQVVDFGISKVLKAATTKLTWRARVVGTPEFMSPEMARAGSTGSITAAISGRWPAWLAHAVGAAARSGNPM